MVTPSFFVTRFYYGSLRRNLHLKGEEDGRTESQGKRGVSIDILDLREKRFHPVSFVSREGVFDEYSRF